MGMLLEASWIHRIQVIQFQRIPLIRSFSSIANNSINFAQIDKRWYRKWFCLLAASTIISGLSENDHFGFCYLSIPQHICGYRGTVQRVILYPWYIGSRGLLLPRRQRSSIQHLCQVIDQKLEGKKKEISYRLIHLQIFQTAIWT